MAVDEAILESVGRHEALPTLRLYAWDPPCLSLGFAQPFNDVDREALSQNGWQVVRRPTGGRAILHTDELTYSVMAPLDEPRVYGKVLESYRRLAQALIAALRSLGLPAQADQAYALPEGTQASGAICFETPSNYEITVAGKKLMGSAQARRKEGILQHGSLPLCGDLTRITRALVYPGEPERRLAGQRLLSHATTVEALGKMVTWAEAAAAFAAAFESTLQIEFKAEALSAAELSRADRLVMEKYGHPDWTERL